MAETLPLSEATQKFVLHWGEMGARWGINRSVAQVHALLFSSERPLNAEEIAQALGLARSNVSTAVRELQTWKLVRITHLPGDRRDHFMTSGDAWEMCQAILAERKRRELDPAIAVLKDCLAEGRPRQERDGLATSRLRELLELFETVDGFYEHTRTMPKDTLLKAMKLGKQMAALLDTALRRPSRSSKNRP
jgi:DNA-binding transcriptional regulator GbsR (MarR family)